MKIYFYLYFSCPKISLHSQLGPEGVNFKWTERGRGKMGQLKRTIGNHGCKTKAGLGNAHPGLENYLGCRKHDATLHHACFNQ
jgi:hypothetical protein